MTALISSLQDRLKKREQYNRIVEEIRRMPLDVALDLDIYQGDAERIAYAHVYGNDRRAA